jgi:hypothetical protein
MTTQNAIFENLRKFEVEMVFTDNGNIANITEGGVRLWTIYAHTAKSLKSQVTKWCKSNW